MIARARPARTDRARAWALRPLGDIGNDGPRYCFNEDCGTNDCDIWDGMEACGNERPTLELLPGECCSHETDEVQP